MGVPLLMGAILRLYQLGAGGLVSDESHFAPAAVQVALGGVPLGWADWNLPPLLIKVGMFGIRLFGYSAFSVRIIGVFCGTATVLLLFLFVKRLTGSDLPAFAAAALLAIDPLHISLSRIYFPEVFVTFFCLLAFHLLWASLSGERSGAPSVTTIAVVMLGALSLGMAATGKWYGLLAVAVALIAYIGIFLYQRRPARPGRRGTQVPRLSSLVPPVIVILFVPVSIYLLSYLPWFSFGHSLPEWFGLQKAIIYYNSDISQAGSPLKFATHPLSWFILPKPFPFAYSQSPSRMALKAGIANPFVQWTMLAGFLHCGWVIYKKKRLTSAYLLLIFAGMYLPWFLAPRSLFIYSLLPLMPLGYALAGKMLHETLEWGSGMAKKGLLAVLVLDGTFSLLLYPVVVGMVVDKGFYTVLMRLLGLTTFH